MSYQPTQSDFFMFRPRGFPPSMATEYLEFSDEILDRLSHRSACDCRIGKGWIGIVNDIMVGLKETDPDFIIIQIKEKFGGLQFYTSDLSDEGLDVVHSNRHISHTRCEICGDVGALMSDRWISTRCELHR